MFWRSMSRVNPWYAHFVRSFRQASCSRENNSVFCILNNLHKIDLILCLTWMGERTGYAAVEPLYRSLLVISNGVICIIVGRREQ